MKTLILIFIMSVVYSNYGITQEFGYSEFYIANKSGSTSSGGHEIKIKIYPVGAFYNYLEQYSPDIKGDPLLNHYQYLVGFSRRCWCSKKFAY